MVVVVWGLYHPPDPDPPDPVSSVEETHINWTQVIFRKKWT
jgi:hypothetical protein